MTVAETKIAIIKKILEHDRTLLNREEIIELIINTELPEEKITYYSSARRPYIVETVNCHD